MFKISRKKLNCCITTNLIQSIDELFEGFGFDDLVEPGVKVGMSTAFEEVFKRFSQIVNPEGGNKKVYAFDALRLLEFTCCTWSELFVSVASSCEEVLHDKSLLKKEVQKLSDQKNQRVKKISRELDVSCKKFREVQDAFAQR